MQLPPHTAIPASRAIAASRSVSGGASSTRLLVPAREDHGAPRAGRGGRAQLLLEQRVRHGEDHEVDAAPSISAIDPNAR